MANTPKTISHILAKDNQGLLEEWIREQNQTVSRQQQLMNPGELREQCSEFLNLLRNATLQGNGDINAVEWGPVRDLLSNISRSRALGGRLADCEPWNRTG